MYALYYSPQTLFLPVQCFPYIHSAAVGHQLVKVHHYEKKCENGSNI